MLTIRLIEKRQGNGSALSEFAPVLYISVILILIPLTNLLFFSMGVLGVQFLVSEAARSASSADTRQGALDAMSSKANQVLNTGILQVAKAKAVGGVSNSGCSLYCTITPVGGGPFDLSLGPLAVSNQPQTGTNASKLIYQYVVEGQYSVSPLLDMSAVPFIGRIPGLAGSQPVRFSTSAVVENLQALNN